jgi:hypothetical protein
MGREVASGLDFGPVHGESVESPEIIHVGRVGITTKVENGLVDETTAVTPSGGRVRRRLEIAVNFVPSVFFHLISFLG